MEYSAKKVNSRAALQRRKTRYQHLAAEHRVALQRFTTMEYYATKKPKKGSPAAEEFPVVEASRGGLTKKFYTLDDFEDWKDDQYSGTKGWKVEYFQDGVLLDPVVEDEVEEAAPTSSQNLRVSSHSEDDLDDMVGVDGPNGTGEPVGFYFQGKGEEEVIWGKDLEDEVTKWLERVTGEKRGDKSLHEWLGDGQMLCKAANMVQPGIVRKINTQDAPFRKMENLSIFIGVCRMLCVLEKDLFSTNDLYEEKNIEVVQLCIFNFASVIRSCPTFQGPYLGAAQNAKMKDVARPVEHSQATYGLRRDVQDNVKANAHTGRHGVLDKLNKLQKT